MTRFIRFVAPALLISANVAWAQYDSLVAPPEKNSSSSLSSKDYFRGAGGTDSAFVRQLYRDQLGRAPTDAEMKYWTGLLRSRSRKVVADRIVRLSPRKVAAPLFPYTPPYIPDPIVVSPRDPRGSHFRGPYAYYYDYRPARMPPLIPR